VLTLGATDALQLDHVTAIVADGRALSRVLDTVLGVAPASEIQLAGMRIQTFRVGGVELHVNEPTGPGPVQSALERNGPGFHHVAFACADLDATLARLASQGIAAHGAPVETAPGIREVFLDPTTTGGLYLQLVERRTTEVARALDSDAVNALASVSKEETRRR
jgi:methylmalonyl-CoA/ethylmalonyl-CoA epimerase